MPADELNLKFIDPDGVTLSSEIEDSLGLKRDAPLFDVAMDAINLSESAIAFFRGIYPIEAPYFMWGDGYWLPWHVEYWVKETGDLRPRSIKHEMPAIVRALNPTTWSDSPLTFLRLESSEKKAEMQSLAVETILLADSCLVSISNNRLDQSALHLSLAYKCIIECTVLAHSILGIASENARKAANARHLENRSMKDQIWELYERTRHEYRSKDSAATAMAGKVVPCQFRTVRKWIKEWHDKHGG